MTTISQKIKFQIAIEKLVDIFLFCYFQKNK